MRVTPILLGGVLAALLSSTACTSSAVDPRCKIETPALYRARVAKHVNGSKLWRAYFDTMAPDPATATPWITFRLSVERKVGRRSSGGDYDAGWVKIDFAVVNGRTRSTLYQREEEVRLPSMTIVFKETSSREEVQQAVFEQTEDDIFPYIDRWLNIAAIRAMGQEGAAGYPFVELLEEQKNDPWAEDLQTEANHALNAINRKL